MSIPDLVVQPLLAVFPHGLQHHARRNAHRAMGLAAAGRRDRQAADTSVRANIEAHPALVTAR